VADRVADGRRDAAALPSALPSTEPPTCTGAVGEELVDNPAGVLTHERSIRKPVTVDVGGRLLVEKIIRPRLSVTDR